MVFDNNIYATTLSPPPPPPPPPPHTHTHTHTHTRSPPVAAHGDEMADGDHVGQVWDHDNKVDQEALLGKEGRRRLSDMPPDESRQELRCVHV